MKQAEDDLVKITRISGKNNVSLLQIITNLFKIRPMILFVIFFQNAAIEVARILCLVIKRLKTERYNQIGVMRWQVIVK